MDDDRLDNVRDALSSVYPLDDESSSLLKMLDGIDRLGGDNGLFPLMFISVPHTYLTRNGRRVDICGTIDEQSDEFKHGYRYFSDTGELFYKDGKCRPQGDNPCDLVSLMDKEGDGFVEKSPIPHRWVHPQYWLMSTWFHEPSRDDMYLSREIHYRNRMGMIISVTPVDGRAGDVTQMFHDASGRRYASNGNLLGARWSMFDLIAEVKSWPIFREHDWSIPGIPTKQNTGNQPQLFDPTDDDRGEKMKSFFAKMAELNILAEDLGIRLSMNAN